MTRLDVPGEQVFPGAGFALNQSQPDAWARPAGAVHRRGAWPAIATPTRVTGRLPAGVVAPNDLVPGLVALSGSSIHTFRAIFLPDGS